MLFRPGGTRSGARQPGAARSHHTRERQVSGAKTNGSYEPTADSRQPNVRLTSQPANPCQYVARPPDKSNTAPVEKLQSSDASQATIAATSATFTRRPIGILPSM